MSADDRIKRWLARAPTPVLVVAELADGSDKRIKITTGRYKWADAVRAVGDAVKITALDADGAELRVLELDELDDEPAAAAEQPRAADERRTELGEFRAMLAQEIPALVRSISTAIVDASRTAAEQSSAGYQGAFSALLGVVQTQGALARSSISDQVDLLRELQQARTAAAPAGAAEGDPNDALFAMLLQQQAAGGMPNGNGNGHGAHPLAFLKDVDPQILQALIARFTNPGAPNGAPPTGETS